MTNDRPRLIEATSPQKQASLDSVHEKNVSHGHMSTRHIWPARCPLAASRAALIASLLPELGAERESNRSRDTYIRLLVRAKGGVVVDESSVFEAAEE